jgi:hypothetical protein
MSAAANGPARRAEKKQYEADHQDDDSDRPQDRDLGDEAHDQENEAEYDHEGLLSFSGDS